MDLLIFLNTFSALQVSLIFLTLICSLPLGYWLGYIAKEELVSLQKILNITSFLLLLCFFGILASFFFFFSEQLFFLILALIFILGILRGSSYPLKIKKTSKKADR